MRLRDVHACAVPSQPPHTTGSRRVSCRRKENTKWNDYDRHLAFLSPVISTDHTNQIIGTKRQELVFTTKALTFHFQHGSAQSFPLRSPPIQLFDPEVALQWSSREVDEHCESVGQL